jgi:hypothetical protein
MIYDFGCNDPVKFLDKLLPALAGVGAVLLVLAGMSALGALVQRRSEFRATDVFCGWGIVAAFMTLVAVSFSHALLWAALILAVFLVGAIWRAAKCGYFISPFWLLALFPGVIILTGINFAGISEWDDFSHWVPNALYLFHYDGVPSLTMPPPHSIWPSYPYAIPFLTYLASLLAAGFLMQGGAMFNFLLLLAFAALLARTKLPSTQRQSNDPLENGTPLNARTIGLAGLALLVTTLANPSFSPRFTMSSEGDTSTMILVGTLGLLLWQMIDALQQRLTRVINDLTVQIALTATALVLIKQVDFILFGLLVFAFLVVACKNKILKSAIIQLPFMLAPAFIARLIWQQYVDVEMGGAGFAVQPLSSWHFDLIGPLARAMLVEAVKNNGLYGMTLITIAIGTISFFRPPTSFRNFALLAAIVCGGYLLVLFTAYVGSTFGKIEIVRAASFYRYTTHIGFLGTGFLWIAIAQLWLRLKEKSLTPAVPTFLASPKHRTACVFFLLCTLPLALMVRSRWIVQGTNAETCRYLNIGHKVALAIPDHASLAVVTPKDSGFFSIVVNFALALSEAQDGHSAAIIARINDVTSLPALLQQLINDGKVMYCSESSVSDCTANGRGYRVVVLNGDAFRETVISNCSSLACTKPPH